LAEVKGEKRKEKREKRKEKREKRKEKREEGVKGGLHVVCEKWS